MFKSVEFYVITCGGCGCTFAITNQMDDRLRETHKWFYCPNGCYRHYPQKTEKEILEDKLRAVEGSEKHYRECCERKERSLSATKGVVTKLKNKLTEAAPDEN